jgi:hypothetical protein
MTDDEAALRRVWASVIIQALKDATTNSPRPTLQAAKRQAHAWFTAKSGVTAERFMAVCLAADFDPDDVRNFYTSYEGPPLTDQVLSRLRDKKLKGESDAN